MLRTNLLVAFATASFFALVLSSCGESPAVGTPHALSEPEKSSHADCTQLRSDRPPERPTSPSTTSPLPRRR